MKKYELAILVKPVLPEYITSTVEPAIRKLVEEHGGKMGDIEKWNKQHLAYPIQSHEEGYYAFPKVELDPATVATLSRKLRLMRDVLRFLLVKEEDL